LYSCGLSKNCFPRDNPTLFYEAVKSGMTGFVVPVGFFGKFFDLFLNTAGYTMCPVRKTNLLTNQRFLRHRREKRKGISIRCPHSVSLQEPYHSQRNPTPRITTGRKVCE